MKNKQREYLDVSDKNTLDIVNTERNTEQRDKKF